MRFAWVVVMLVLAACDGRPVPSNGQAARPAGGLPEGCVMLADDVDRKFSGAAGSFFRGQVGVPVTDVTLDRGWACGKRLVFPIRALAEGQPHPRDWFVEMAQDGSGAELMRPE